MEVVRVIKTKDGELFEDERKALQHCEDKAGEEFDGLTRLIPDIGHRSRMKLLESFLDNPKEVKIMCDWIQEHHKVKQEV